MDNLYAEPCLVKSIGYETLNPSRMTAGRQVQGDTNILFQQAGKN